MSTKKTAEDRAQARFASAYTMQQDFDGYFVQVPNEYREKREAYATCIREEVEPREAEVVAKNAEIEQLRVLVQELVNACHCSGHAGMQTGAQASAIRTAKQAGFVPTNTEDNG